MSAPTPMEAAARALADAQNDSGNGTRSDVFWTVNDWHRRAARVECGSGAAGGWVGDAAGEGVGMRKFIEWGDDVVRRAERGDLDALQWCGFVTLTLISVVVIAAVAALLWWLS